MNVCLKVCVSHRLLGVHVRICPVGFPSADPSLREDRIEEEGPHLTAPGNDSLQMLCSVTSANHNAPLKPQKCDTKHRAAAFFCSHNEATA